MYAINWDKVVNRLIIGIAILMAAYHLTMTQYILVTPILHQDIHLLFVLTLVFLEAFRTRKYKKLRLLILPLLLIGIGVTTYIFIDYPRLEYARGFPTPVDMVLSFALMAVVIEASRLAWGPVFLMLVGGLILYLFFGHLLPSPIGHMEMPFDLMVSYLGIGLEGVFGPILSVSANYIYLFVLFGALMQMGGATQFFMEVGKLLGRKLRGGPADVAVLSSSLIGMVTGNTMANVIITGSFTIPLMKKAGYKPEIAGAIEAAASTGGQIMPPVMGATVFLLAYLTGMPYAEVMIAALIPAVFYFIGIFAGVEFIARRAGIQCREEQVNMRPLLTCAPVFVIPLGVLIWLLMARYSPMYAGFWSIVTVFVVSLIQKQTRPSISLILDSIAEGGVAGAKIGAACAVIGIGVVVLTVTGLGQKISSIVEMLAHGNLMIALILTMFLSIILGTGLPTIAAYLIVAICVAPSLVRMGLPLLASHLFVFYFAVMACVTPPHAPAALPASQIAGCGFIRTALHATRLAAAGFILPFIFVANPALLLDFAEPVRGILTLIATTIAIVLLQATIYGYLLTKLSIIERIAGFASTAGLLAFCIVGTYIGFSAGIGILIVILLSQRRKNKVVNNETPP